MYRDTTAPLRPRRLLVGVFDHVRALGEKDLSFAIELAGTLGSTYRSRSSRAERLAKGLGTVGMGKFDDLPRSAGAASSGWRRSTASR
jgi:hypothetical protein